MQTVFWGLWILQPLLWAGVSVLTTWRITWHYFCTNQALSSFAETQWNLLAVEAVVATESCPGCLASHPTVDYFHAVVVGKNAGFTTRSHKTSLAGTIQCHCFSFTELKMTGLALAKTNRLSLTHSGQSTTNSDYFAINIGLLAFKSLSYSFAHLSEATTSYHIFFSCMAAVNTSPRLIP